MERKEAIEIARKLYNDSLFLKKDKEAMVTLIPELKENEDEIRKAVIDAVETLSNSPLKVKMLAWLENQNEQKPVDKIQLGKKYKCIASPRYSTFMRGFIYKPNDKFLCSLMNFCSDCFEPIEDGEQKTADKVEPKFHEGDWVVSNEYPNCGNSLMRIVEVGLTDYLCRYYNGQTTYCHKFIDKSYHMWTIQDAKDGDVIYSRHNTESFEWIGIFKSLDKENKRVFFYGFWYDMAKTFSVCRNEAYVLYDDFSLATKEQRDLLFQKMKEAGYEWDAEKKELKKISQEYPLTPDECIKSSWSEEDEENFNWFEKFFRAESVIAGGKDIPQDRYLWFKNLKDRVQPKQEWSEEDKVILDEIIDFFENGTVKLQHDLSLYASWLKSLRPQNRGVYNPYKVVVNSIAEMCDKYKSFSEDRANDFINNIKVKCKDAKEYDSLYPQSTWNPSKKQMKDLAFVADQNKGNMVGKTMISLYKDLTKLTE